MVNNVILELDVLGFRQLPAWDAPDDQGHPDRSTVLYDVVEMRDIRRMHIFFADTGRIDFY